MGQLALGRLDSPSGKIIDFSSHVDTITNRYYYNGATFGDGYETDPILINKRESDQVDLLVYCNMPINAIFTTDTGSGRSSVEVQVLYSIDNGVTWISLFQSNDNILDGVFGWSMANATSYVTLSFPIYNISSETIKLKYKFKNLNVVNTNIVSRINYSFDPGGTFYNVNNKLLTGFHVFQLIPSNPTFNNLPVYSSKSRRQCERNKGILVNIKECVDKNQVNQSWSTPTFEYYFPQYTKRKGTSIFAIITAHLTYNFREVDPRRIGVNVEYSIDNSSTWNYYGSTNLIGLGGETGPFWTISVEIPVYLNNVTSNKIRFRIIHERFGLGPRNTLNSDNLYPYNNKVIIYELQDNVIIERSKSFNRSTLSRSVDKKISWDEYNNSIFIPRDNENIWYELSTFPLTGDYIKESDSKIHISLYTSSRPTIVVSNWGGIFDPTVVTLHGSLRLSYSIDNGVTWTLFPSRYNKLSFSTNANFQAEYWGNSTRLDIYLTEDEIGNDIFATNIRFKVEVSLDWNCNPTGRVNSPTGIRVGSNSSVVGDDGINRLSTNFTFVEFKP